MVFPYKIPFELIKFYSSQYIHIYGLKGLFRIMKKAYKTDRYKKLDINQGKNGHIMFNLLCDPVHIMTTLY